MSGGSGRGKDLTSKQLFWPGTGKGHEYLPMISVMVTSWFSMAPRQYSHILFTQ